MSAETTEPKDADKLADNVRLAAELLKMSIHQLYNHYAKQDHNKLTTQDNITLTYLSKKLRQASKLHQELQQLCLPH